MESYPIQNETSRWNCLWYWWKRWFHIKFGCGGNVQWGIDGGNEGDWKWCSGCYNLKRYGPAFGKGLPEDSLKVKGE